MHRFLLGVLFLLPTSAAFAQEPEPAAEVAQVKGDPVPEGRVRLVRETGAHTGKPNAAVFTPDGKKIVTVAEDRTAQVWDVASRSRLRVFHLPMGVDGNGGVVDVGQTLVVDRQGQRVAFCVQARDDNLKDRTRWFTGGYGFWEKTTGNYWKEHHHSGPITFVELGRTDDAIEMFDKSRKNTVKLYKDHCSIKNEKGEFRFLYNGSWGKGTTFVCSLETGQVKVLERFGPRDFSPDGKYLAVAEVGVVRLVDIETDTPLLPAADLGRLVTHLHYAPDGKTLAVTTHDGKFHLLDAETLKLRKTWTVPGASAVRNVTWADDHTVVCNCVPRGKAVAVVDVDTGTVKHAYTFADIWPELPKGTNHDMDIEAVAGTTRAFVRHRFGTPTGAAPRGGFLFDWTTGTSSERFMLSSWIASRASAIAPDLSVAAQGHGDWNEILLWNPKDGKALMDGKKQQRLRTPMQGAEGGYGGIRWFSNESVSWVQQPAHSHHELDLTTLTLRSVSKDEFKKSSQKMADQIRGDAPADKEWLGRQMYERGIMHHWEKLSLVNKSGIYSVGGGPEPLVLDARSPISWDATFVAGGRVVFSSYYTPVLQVFDSATAKRLHATRMAYSDVRSLTVSPDRRFVAAGSLDQTIAICNPATGKLLLTIFPTGSDWIAWTPEGYYAGTPGGERLMGWHVDNGPDKLASFYPAERFRKRFYRPDVIKLVLKTGSVEAALKTADAALGRETRDAKFDDVLPPSTQLTLVEQNKSSLKLRVKAHAQAAKQPITAVRLFLDGRPVPGKEHVAEFPAGKQKAEVDWTFELPEGEHQLTVLVRGPDSSSVSSPLRLKHAELKKLPTLHVLTIGINDYQDNSLDLKFAAPDATALAAAFSKHCKGQAFADVKTTTLLNKDATAKEILRQLADMRKDTKQEDLAVVFFACHGVKQKEGYFLLTHEANLASLSDSALSGDVLRKALGEFKCQVLLMLDACHSAGFGAGKKLTNLGLKPATDDVARDLTEDDVGIAVMCAAMSHEKAEGVDGHGLFTKALLEALEAKPEVPRNRRNQRIYVHHLQTYVFDEVSDRSQDRQHPFLSLPWVVESFVVR